MPTEEHVIQFAGKPVVDWEPGTAIEDPGSAVVRISLSWEEGEEGEHWTDKFAAFLASLPAPGHADLFSPNSVPAAPALYGLVVGPWEQVIPRASSQPVVEALVAARGQLAGLRALFLGDITREESEISWIVQSDVSPLFAAYPELEQFCVRGGQGLSLGIPHHERLRSLVLQTGGLPAAVLREVCAAHLPELEHLELWLGEDQYGWDATVADLSPILSGTLFPKLQYLGLRDSQEADEIAAAVASAPIVERIRVLDLSLGTLGDQGAMSLLASPAVARLQKLDLHHHFCSEAVVEKLRALGPIVDTSDPQEPEEYDGDSWRYVAVGE